MKFLRARRFACLTGLLLMLVIFSPFTAAAINPQPEPPGEAIGVLIDGTPLNTDVAPLLQQDRVLVPMRAIFEALGATVIWNGADQSVVAEKGDLSVKLQIGSTTAFKNGMQVELDVPPILFNDRTLVPVRFVSEALGAKVDWDGAEQKVIITSAAVPPVVEKSAIIAPVMLPDVTRKVHDDFSRLLRVEKLPVSSALQIQRDFLLKQADVKEVTILQGGNLLVQFKNDYQLMMFLGEDTLGSESLSSTGSMQQLQALPGAVNPDSTPSGMVEKSNVILAPSTNIINQVKVSPELIKVFGPPCNPKANKALIFDCLEDDANAVSPKIASQVLSRLTEMGYSVTNKLNNQANLANAALIDNGEYGVVFMRGHGGVIGSSFGFLVRPWYTSPPPMNSGYTGTIPASAHNYAAGGAVQYGYVITGQFASTYWADKAFPGTMFFLESCHGTDPAGLPGMPAWTISHGAGEWLGWNDSVSFGCGDKGSKLFFNSIFSKNISEVLADVIATGCRPPDLTVYPTNKGSCKLANYINDPNEATVPDGRDFKQLKMISSNMYFFGDISFYAPPVFDEFFLYVSTDWTNEAEVLVRCHPGNFEVYKKTGPGLYTDKVFTGTPKTSGNVYSLAIPRATAFGGASSINVWLYDMTGKDRLPNLPLIK